LPIPRTSYFASAIIHPCGDCGKLPAYQIGHTPASQVAVI
jgi:hypothetical protein